MAPVNPCFINDGNLEDRYGHLWDEHTDCKGVKVTNSDRTIDFVGFFTVWYYPEGLDSELCSLFGSDSYFPGVFGIPLRAIQLLQRKRLVNVTLPHGDVT